MLYSRNRFSEAISAVVQTHLQNLLCSIVEFASLVIALLAYARSSRASRWELAKIACRLQFATIRAVCLGGQHCVHYYESVCLQLLVTLTKQEQAALLAVGVQTSWRGFVCIEAGSRLRCVIAEGAITHLHQGKDWHSRCAAGFIAQRSRLLNRGMMQRNIAADRTWPRPGPRSQLTRLQAQWLGVGVSKYRVSHRTWLRERSNN